MIWCLDDEHQVFQPRFLKRRGFFFELR